MNVAVLFFIGLLVLALVVSAIVWKMSRKRGLAAASAQRYKTLMRQAAERSDLHRRVIDSEKVLDRALQDLGFEGSMADKLRAAGPRFSQLQAIWDAHKLRNRIVHELSLAITETQANAAAAVFERALNDLC